MMKKNRVDILARLRGLGKVFEENGLNVEVSEDFEVDLFGGVHPVFYLIIFNERKKVGRVYEDFSFESPWITWERIIKKNIKKYSKKHDRRKKKI
jgi:hypothetical protein